MLAMVYKRGQWEPSGALRIEMEQACERHNGHVDAGLLDLGFELWARIGDSELGINNPISLTVYRRLTDKTPTFYMQIDGHRSSFGDEVYAETIADLMDLLARWMPAVQGAAEVDRLCIPADAEV